METVSHRAKYVKQPRGGYIKPSSMNVIVRNDNIELYEDENVSPSIVGTVVDYMTRFLEEGSAEEAFRIPLLGAKLIKKEKAALSLINKIKGLDKKSIISACKIVGFDAVYRAGPLAYKPIEEINPDEKTIFNIIAMIKRSQSFLEEYGPIVAEGMTFLGGYTPTVISGDADFMTEDTIWDFKVTKNAIKSFQILQVLMYYLMGCRSIKLNEEYDFANKIKKIGIYNPRKNEVYIKYISDIDKEIINQVEKDVIGYGEGIVDPHLKEILKEIKNKKK